MLRARVLLIALVGFGASGAASHGQDPAIERLLKKLPPPEKLVKPSVSQAVEKPDAAMKDPLVRSMLTELARGNMAAGLAAARSVAAKYPQSAAAQELHALIAYVARQFPESVAALRRAIAIAPKRSSPHLGLVLVHLAQRRPAAALPHARRVTELEPNYADGWLLRSGCEEQTGNKQQSAASARQAVKLAPASLAAWMQLARMENMLGRTSEAVRALSQAAEIAPDNASLQATVGFGYININRSADAVRPLSRAARLAPKDHLIQAQLGWALFAAGQTDAAIQHLRRGASLKPSYGPVWQHLGLAYQKQGRHREALEAFQRAARIMPTNQRVRAHLAEAQRALAQSPRR